PWSLSHLLAFQGAGRLHVNVGWRHPRPVAANDGRIVTTLHPHGDSKCRPNILTACRPGQWPVNGRSANHIAWRTLKGHRAQDRLLEAVICSTCTLSDSLIRS